MGSENNPANRDVPMTAETMIDEKLKSLRLRLAKGEITQSKFDEQTAEVMADWLAINGVPIEPIDRLADEIGKLGGFDIYR